MAKSVVEEARDNWKLTSAVYGQQKKDEIEDLSFLLPENQWDQWAIDARAADTTNGLAARPMISVDKLSQPINIQVNKLRNAHLGITVNPESEDADKDTAEVIQGIYRKWEQNSNADLARFWAFERAIQAGTGVYFIGYDYDRTTGHPFDQSVVWRRIMNQADVYFDPSAQEMDWSDGEYVFWIKWLSRSQFQQKYSKSALAQRLALGGTEGAWSDIIQAAPDWAQASPVDDTKRAIMVAEYWKKVYTPRKALLLDDWSFVYADQEGAVPKGRKPMEGKDGKPVERVVQEQSLMYYCLTGLDDKPLHEEKWNGKYFPFVPVIGNEIQTFDDKRRWRGMIRNAKGVQKTFNYAFTDLVETVGLQSKATYLADPRQIEKHRKWWNVRNVRPIPYLPYDSVIDGAGNPLPPPQLAQVDSSKMQTGLMLLQEAGQAIDDVTATYAPSRGETDTHRSGKAVLALQSQSDESSGGFESNFVEISLPCEARIVLDYMPTLLERPGRMIDMVTPDEQSQRIMMNAPHVTEGGMPKRVKEGTEGAKFFDIRKGIYSVETEAGKSYASRLKQGQEQYPLLMQALPPEGAMILAPDVIRFSPAPGAQATADKMQKFVDHQFPFLAESKDGEPTPDQLKAELAASKQQIEQMTQIGSQMQKELETKAAEQQGKLMIEMVKAQVAAAKSQSDNEVKVAINREDNQTALAVAGIKAGLDELRLEVETRLGLMSEREKMAEERRLDDSEGGHQVGMEAMKQAGAKEQREHDRAMAEQGMGNEAGMAVAGMRHETQEGERARAHESAEGAAGREHEAEQAERAAEAAEGAEE